MQRGERAEEGAKARGGGGLSMEEVVETREEYKDKRQAGWNVEQDYQIVPQVNGEARRGSADWSRLCLLALQ